MNAGIPVEKTALGINQLCGSGLRAVAFGWQAIRNGDANIMVVGGQESMSQAPHAGHLRDGTKMGDFKMLDTMLKDGLWDAFHGYHITIHLIIISSFHHHLIIIIIIIIIISSSSSHHHLIIIIIISSSHHSHHHPITIISSSSHHLLIIFS